MWQAQLKGSKTWFLRPTPECQDVCKSFSFSVEAGDAGKGPIRKSLFFFNVIYIAVLIDTRVWYHGTKIAKGEFSLSIQSEYG